MLFLCIVSHNICSVTENTNVDLQVYAKYKHKYNIYLIIFLMF